MAYNIYKSDGTALLALDDYLIDNTTLSINLIGKNVSGYGAQQNENFLYLLENFSKETPPANPLAGQIWYDKAVGVVRPMFYDGGTWRPIGVTLYSNTNTDTTIASGATITSQGPGDFWFNTDKQQLFINTGSSYTLIGPEAAPGFGTTKMSSVTMQDNQLDEHPVIQMVIDNEVIGVLSSQTFTGGPAETASGFPHVYRGLTLKNYNAETRYSTTSTDVILHALHEQLDETYPRRDVDEHIRANWFFDDDYMLQFGAAGNSKISFNNPGGGFPNKLTIDHGTGVIVLASNGASLQFDGTALQPNATNTQDLGSTALRFNNVYTKNLNSGGPLTSAAMIGTWNLGPASILIPDSDSGNDLGKTTLRFNTIYSFNLSSGTDQGTLKGDWQLDTSIGFIPKTDNTNYLGATNKRFANIYTSGISSADPFLPLNVTGEMTVAGSILPADDITYNIGAPGSTFNTVYSKSVESASANIGSLTATVNQLLDSFSNTVTRFDRDAQLTANSDSRLPTQKSVKAYVDAIRNGLIAQIAALQTQLQNQINSLEFVPSGSVFYLATSTCPAGYLVCDGKAYTTTGYPRLFAAIGYTYGGSGTTFNVPDLRGQFVRGWDSAGGTARGIDSGRLFANTQADAIGSHTHNVDDLYGLNDDQGPALYDRNGNRVEYFSGWGSDGDGDSGNPAFFLNRTADGATGTETRPTNVALLPIIKF